MREGLYWLTFGARRSRRRLDEPLLLLRLRRGIKFCYPNQPCPARAKLCLHREQGGKAQQMGGKARVRDMNQKWCEAKEVYVSYELNEFMV